MKPSIIISLDSKLIYSCDIQQLYSDDLCSILNKSPFRIDGDYIVTLTSTRQKSDATTGNFIYLSLSDPLISSFYDIGLNLFDFESWIEVKINRDIFFLALYFNTFRFITNEDLLLGVGVPPHSLC
jgi:hypothetical protein